MELYWEMRNVVRVGRINWKGREVSGLGCCFFFAFEKGETESDHLIGQCQFADGQQNSFGENPTGAVANRKPQLLHQILDTKNEEGGKGMSLGLSFGALHSHY